jgi:hypothetical protein
MRWLWDKLHRGPTEFPWPPIVLGAIALLVLLTTVFLGMIAGAQLCQRLHAPRIVVDTRPTIPVVTIEHVRDGRLIGTASGMVRFASSGDIAVINESGSFVLPVTISGGAKPGMVGMAFVASRRGKYYYPSGSPGAGRLSPKNLVYFRDAQSAQAAGYAAGK